MPTTGFGPEIPPFATQAQVTAYVGPTRAADLPSDPDEFDRMILRASELIYYASGNIATRAYEGLLLTDPFGGYIDPLIIPSNLTQADYRFGLALAVGAQIEFWLEFAEEHAIQGLSGSAQSGAVQINRLPDQLAVRAKMHLTSMGIFGAKASIR